MLSTALRTTSRRSVRLATAIHVPHRSMSTKNDELEPGFVEKYKLTDPTRFVPISVTAGLLSTATGLYHWNAESQIAFLFALFVGTVYAKGGDAIGKALDEASEAILKEQNALEDAQIENLKLAIAANTKQATTYADIQEILAGEKALFEKIVDTYNLQIKQDVRAVVVKQLDALVQAEEKVKMKIHDSLVNGAVERVRDMFAEYEDESDDSAKLREKAYATALARFANVKGTSQKAAGVVDGLFQTHFAEVKKEMEAMKNTPIDIPEKLRLDLIESMKAIARRDNLGKIDVSLPKQMTFKDLL